MTAKANTHRWVVDSIEEQAASIELEDGKMIQLPASLLPPGTKDGHVLRVTIDVDDAATREAVAHSADQVRKTSEASKKRDPGGDIVL